MYVMETNTHAKNWPILEAQYLGSHSMTLKKIQRGFNSTLRYECDETFSDECEFAARAEGE